MSGTWNQGKPRQQGGNHGSRTHNDSFRGAGISTITAPYNFVPLSKKVFFPDWARHVSHDLPFEDGVSGELVCELLTHTPVYVRNGGKWDHDQVMKSDEAQSFFYVRQGEKPLFMIPGTTLKGMLRNVIEIASFGKMNKVDDHRYSLRDLHNRSAYLDKMKNVRAGWLVRAQNEETWEIIPCEYALVSHKMLGNEKIKEKQSSLSKYNIWGKDKLDVTIDVKKGSPNNRVTSLAGRACRGRLVFTGQPTRNDGGKFKKSNEFVFFNEVPSRRISVPPRLQRDIRFIYTNPNTGKPYEEWAEWQKVLEKGGKVPIFFQGSDCTVESFGFTRMYRLPYTYSTHDAIRHVDGHTGDDHFHDDPDLAETIFGFVDGSRDALKGRVSISPAVAHRPEQLSPLQVVLGSPKPTYYPNYICQPGAGNSGKLNTDYKTCMDADATVRGWKRYPARPLKDVAKNIDKGTDNVATRMIPLKEGTQFRFAVKFHNLKTAELGALCWALTWGGDSSLRHSLGMGKAMGFGLAAISITSADVDWQSAMGVFEKLMDKEVGGGWRKTAQMEQLTAMANPAAPPQCGSLKHLFLAPGAGNEFANAKNAKLTLMPHVKPAAQPDSGRFKELQPRPRKVSTKSPAATGSDSAAISPKVAPALETWRKATVTFDSGRGEVKAVFEGKSAVAKRSPELEELITRVKKKGHLMVDVAVELLGGKNYKLIKVVTP